jgi:hypothetical protein
VLQDRTVERLGSSQPVKVNVRVVAATNRDLDQAVADRLFREDLFYRLNVFPIRVPPLRERVADILSLVWAFVDELATAFNKPIASISKESLEALHAYEWPGNIRELRNVVERAIIVATGRHLTIDVPVRRTAAGAKSLKLADVEREHIVCVLIDGLARARTRRHCPAARPEADHAGGSDGEARNPAAGSQQTPHWRDLNPIRPSPGSGWSPPRAVEPPVFRSLGARAGSIRDARRPRTPLLQSSLCSICLGRAVRRGAGQFNAKARAHSASDASLVRRAGRRSEPPRHRR